MELELILNIQTESLMFSKTLIKKRIILELEQVSPFVKRLLKDMEVEYG